MSRVAFPLAVAILLLTPPASASIKVYAEIATVEVPAPIDPIPNLPTRPVELSYLATAATGGSFSFSIFLQADATGTIESRWAFGGTPYVEDAAFDNASRALLGTSAYSPFWVTNADLNAGAAILGNDAATYLGLTPLGHLFDSPLASYYFEPTSGVLLLAQTKDLQKVIQLVGESYVAALPPANPSPADDAQVSHPAVDPYVDPREPTVTLDHLPQVTIIGPHDPTVSNVSPPDPVCGNAFNQIFGGKIDCTAPFTVTGPFRITTDNIAFPYDATGNISLELLNPAGKAYHAFVCQGELPFTDGVDQTQPQCGPAGADPTATRDNGQHTLHGVGQIQFCLRPRSGFTCAWNVGVDLQ